MKLLIDIGNTSLKYAFEKQGQLSDIKRIDHQNVTTEAFINQLKKLFVNAESGQTVEKIILASVADNTIAHTIITLAEEANINLEQVFTPSQQFDVTVGYKNHQQLGVDRWLALLGAAKNYAQQNCLIIDLGTATTVDLLRKDGQHLGGWIFPGVYTMQQSLLTNTANIKVNDEQYASLYFANNTSDNVVNGCLAATVGAIDVAIKQALLLVDGLDQIILTGGNAKLIAQGIINISETAASHVVIFDELVFKGLQIYASPE